MDLIPQAEGILSSLTSFWFVFNIFFLLALVWSVLSLVSIWYLSTTDYNPPLTQTGEPPISTLMTLPFVAMKYLMKKKR